MKKYMIIEGSYYLGYGSEMSLDCELFDREEEVKKYMIEKMEDEGWDDFNVDDFMKNGEYEKLDFDNGFKFELKMI